jgi:hypothetical protein
MILFNDRTRAFLKVIHSSAHCIAHQTHQQGEKQHSPHGERHRNQPLPEFILSEPSETSRHQTLVDSMATTKGKQIRGKNQKKKNRSPNSK